MHHEQPDHSNCCPTCALVCLPLVLILRKDDGNDDMASSHADGSDNEHGLATQFVNVCNSREGRNPHHDTHNTGREERGRIAAKTEILEDGRGVVEHSVYTLDACQSS